MIRIVLCAAAALLSAAVSFADIVEVRGRGMMTGKVVSQDEKEIAFRGNDGRVVRFPKSDLLFYDTGGDLPSEVPAARAASGASQFSAKVKDFFAGVPSWFRDLQAYAAKWTRKFRDFAGKPLDRSSADKQSAQLAKVMDEAGRAAAEMAKKKARVDAEVRRQEREAYGLPDEESEGFKGTFGKL